MIVSLVLEKRYEARPNWAAVPKIVPVVEGLSQMGLAWLLRVETHDGDLEKGHEEQEVWVVRMFGRFGCLREYSCRNGGRW